jgi:hypothetical protein
MIIETSNLLGGGATSILYGITRGSLLSSWFDIIIIGCCVADCYFSSLLSRS